MQIYYGEYTGRAGQLIIRQYVHEINRFRFNWHEMLELIIVICGQMEAYVAGKVYRLAQDDVLLINSNVGHATLLRQANTKAMVVHLSPSIFSAYFDNYDVFYFECASNEQTRYDEAFCALRRCVATLMRELTHLESASATMYIEALTLLLAGHLVRHFPPEIRLITPNSKNAVSQKTLNTIIGYTEKNYQKKISLNNIAALTQYNRSYISNFFRVNVGINYYEYLQRVRLRHAIQQLNKTPKSITKIAMDTGFADAKSFSAIFKKYFVLTPTQYRNSIKNELSPVIDELVRIYVPMPDEMVEASLEQYLQGNSAPMSQPVLLSCPQQQKLRQVREACQELLRMMEQIS